MSSHSRDSGVFVVLPRSAPEFSRIRIDVEILRRLGEAPSEVIDKVISNLNVNEADRVTTVTQSAQAVGSMAESGALKLLESVEDRLSVAKYIGRVFTDGQAVLDLMSKAGAYISGSAALNYFVPGTMNEDSDIDFYLPHENSLVEGFVRAMDDFGVKWTGELDHASRIYKDARARGNTLCMDFDPWQISAMEKQWAADPAWGASKNSTEEQKATLLILKAVIDAMPTTRRCCRVEHHDGPLSSVSVVILSEQPWIPRRPRTGTFNRRGINIPIQMIIESREKMEPPPGVFEFHSTCVQNYIGPWTSVCMFPTLTFWKKSYLWKNNVTSDPYYDEPGGSGESADLTRQLMMDKYTERGFKYITHGGASTAVPALKKDDGYVYPRDMLFVTRETQTGNDHLRMLAYTSVTKDMLLSINRWGTHLIYNSHRAIMTAINDLMGRTWDDGCTVVATSRHGD